MDRDQSTDSRSSKPKYRMIAIDLDGTLLSPKGTVTERTKAAVHGCLSAGLLVCFATGRNWTESETVLEAVEHYDTAVFVGGAMVVDTKQRLTVHRTVMQPALARELCAFFENRKLAVLALQDTTTAGVDYLVTADTAMDKSTEMWMQVTKSAVQRVSHLANYTHEHTIRIGVISETGPAIELTNELQKTFGERIVFHSINVPAYGIDVVEVFDPAVNKWEGIQHVAKKHGITQSQIIAIGDDVNDLPMIRQAGLGVAMGNARDEVKAIAKRVIGANRDEGLAVFLEELVKQHAVLPLEE